MAVVRMEALRSLASAIADQVPELGTIVAPVPAPDGMKLKKPSLAIDAVSYTFHPDQEGRVGEVGTDVVVVQCGRHEVLLHLRVIHDSLQHRMQLEQAVLDVFFSTPRKPGILITPVVTVDKFGIFNAAWELDSDEWQPEKFFDREHWSFLAVVGQIPALATRAGHRLRDLRLGLAADLNLVGNATMFDGLNPAVEVVKINADGTLTAVP